jgi:hypothetical protein
MLGFARCFFRGILPLPIIQGIATDTISCLVGFLIVTHFHVRIPFVITLDPNLYNYPRTTFASSASFWPGLRAEGRQARRPKASGINPCCVVAAMNTNHGNHLFIRPVR